jgi:integrase/recombinase XerC
MAAHTLTESRRPVAWALGQATATSGEQAGVRVKDIDLDLGRVWLAASARRTGRWGELTEWGIETIARSIRHNADPEGGLVYAALRSPASGQASVCRAVHEILGDAGYRADPTVRPGSLPAWAGRKLFEQTGQIELVARRMGLRSLDASALAIGWDWQ